MNIDELMAVIDEEAEDYEGIYCVECNWSGFPDELVAEDDSDEFIHCPNAILRSLRSGSSS